MKWKFLVITGAGCRESTPISQIFTDANESVRKSKADLDSVPKFRAIAIQQDIRPTLLIVDLSLPSGELVNLYITDSNQNEVARMIDRHYMYKGNYSKYWDLSSYRLKGSYQLVVEAGTNYYVQKINMGFMRLRTLITIKKIRHLYCTITFISFDKRHIIG